MGSSALAAAFLVIPLTVNAAEPEAFTSLFARTCMKYFYSQDELRLEMSSQKNPALQATQASFFLGGQPGTAWSVQLSDDKYVVALRDDNICTVFAQRAQVKDVQSNFASVVAVAPEPLVSAQRDPAGPNSDSLKTVSYSWSRPDDKVELLFTLTTATEVNPAVQVQAMASIALANKPNNSFKGKPLRGSP